VAPPQLGSDFGKRIPAPTGVVRHKEQAMESIWTKQYTNSVKQIIRQTLIAKLGSYPDFEDVEQETLMHVFAKRNKIPAGIKHNSYIRSIAKNCAYDILRRKYSFKNLANELPANNQVENQDMDGPVHEHFVSYPKEVSDPFVVEMVSEVISQLSPKHQKVLLLRAQDVEYKDMARVLKISEGTVRSRLHYAKKICAEHLAPNMT
jgi:RNA polymerase sigma-70 factor, ECF subfamily